LEEGAVTVMNERRQVHVTAKDLVPGMLFMSKVHSVHSENFVAWQLIVSVNIINDDVELTLFTNYTTIRRETGLIFHHSRPDVLWNWQKMLNAGILCK
jgi:hypothetical protein